MTRARLAAILLAAAALVWWLAGTPGLGAGSHPAPPGAATGLAGSRSMDPGVAQQLGQLAKNHSRSGAIDWRSSPQEDHEGVAITGKVLDQESHTGVGNVEVVFKGSLGESSATTNADGTYRIDVAPGTYRAFVRDDNALSVGMEDLVRVPGMPSPDAANAPDDALMPTIVAVTDVDHVDLSVLFGGTVAGTVVDRSGHAVVGAVLRARGGALRPALGTDVAESDEHGHFDMRLPPGPYALEATHAQLVGVTGTTEMVIERGQTAHPNVTLTAGCVISGRVVGTNGKPAGDGAIEHRFGPGENDFGPAGRIEADGTFRWVTGVAESVSLRAWPWKSPPAPAQTFACRDGARFTNVVFAIPDLPPDIAGTLVDAAGEPVAFGYIDVSPVDGGFSQQERSDMAGKWAVYHMPPKRYRITATTSSKGVVAMEIDAPKVDVKLVLGGTGRIEGTTTGLVEGSFELTLQTCDGILALPHAPRLVAVHGGKFAIDDVPACGLYASAAWQGEESGVEVVVPANGVAATEIEVGPAAEKSIHGVVRDEGGQPQANVAVSGMARGRPLQAATTDASGTYTLHTFVGADVIAADDTGRQGYRQVGKGLGDEELDITLGAIAPPDEGVEGVEGDEGVEADAADVRVPRE